MTDDIPMMKKSKKSKKATKINPMQIDGFLTKEPAKGSLFDRIKGDLMDKCALVSIRATDDSYQDVIRCFKKLREELYQVKIGYGKLNVSISEDLDKVFFSSPLACADYADKVAEAISQGAYDDDIKAYIKMMRSRMDYCRSQRKCC